MKYASKHAPDHTTDPEPANDSGVRSQRGPLRVVKRPHPPVVAAALSGFVVGVIFTLLLTGALAHHGSASPPATLPSGQAISDAAMKGRLIRMVTRQLGPAYPDTRAHRLLSLQLSRVRLPDVAPPQPDSGYQFRSVDIVFRLNDHPLGAGWRLRAAKADVFEVLKALYTSKLPVYSVYMDGLFPRKMGKSMRDQPAVQVYIDYQTASRIPWKRWGRESENRLWTTLTLRYVAPWFA